MVGGCARTAWGSPGRLAASLCPPSALPGGSRSPPSPPCPAWLQEQCPGEGRAGEGPGSPWGCCGALRGVAVGCYRILQRQLWGTAWGAAGQHQGLAERLWGSWQGVLWGSSAGCYGAARSTCSHAASHPTGGCRLPAGGHWENGAEAGKFIMEEGSSDRGGDPALCWHLAVLGGRRCRGHRGRSHPLAHGAAAPSRCHLLARQAWAASGMCRSGARAGGLSAGAVPTLGQRGAW